MSHPTTTVIVPVYNDPAGVRTTLESLRPQLDDAHCYVVDNGSTDATPAAINEYASDHDTITHLVEDEIQSSYAARNTGIRHSTGDLIAFVDADMTVTDGWLEAIRDAFETGEADYVGSRVELTLPDDPSLAARYDDHTGFPVRGYLESQGFAPTCCLAVRRAVFEDVGLFDHRLESGGDKEFGNRVREADYDLGYVPGATMYHPVRGTVRALVKKDLRVGRGLCQLQRYHSDRYGRPGIPPRPSGIKLPDPDLETRERLAFGALSRALTGVRGIGYYREYLEVVRSSETERGDGVPTLEAGE